MWLRVGLFVYVYYLATEDFGDFFTCHFHILSDNVRRHVIIIFILTTMKINRLVAFSLTIKRERKWQEWKV